jgi:hypothetical protein
MKSYFKNWRKHEANSKRKDISTAFPVSANKNNMKGLDIEFQNAFGERISFCLNEHDTNLLFMHIDKRYHGKNVTREDYNLDELYFLNK